MAHWFIVGRSAEMTLFVFMALLPCQLLRAADSWEAAVNAGNAGDYRRAVELATRAISDAPTHGTMFYYRGRWNFQAGDIKASLADFDRVIAEEPQRASSLWERGITCYYAGEFRRGARQFESYQTFHSNDVENAVWRYLCQAKFAGPAQAREAMLPIQRDSRVPMMTIYELFRGHAQPEDVLVRVKQSDAAVADAKQELFHAHLYLALYYDSEGNLPVARDHIGAAVKMYEAGPYMWSVAKQHQQQLTAAMRREKADTKVKAVGDAIEDGDAKADDNGGSAINGGF